MRVMIAGSGLIGGALAHHLAGTGIPAVMCSRRPPVSQPGPAAVAPASVGPSGVAPVSAGPVTTRPAGAGSSTVEDSADLPPAWLALDVTDAAACRAAADLAQPDAVVLVHGPSDVTWCQSHPAEALAAHTRAAANLVAAVPAAHFIGVSTDNVFRGDADTYDESAIPHPANAYGRAKLGAEQILRERSARVTVLRASAVYGWQPGGGQWLNFFAHCVQQLERGQPVAAPYDHWNTPLLVDDVVRVIAALLPAPPSGPLHLGGPDRISRYGWAVAIGQALGRPRDLVTPVRREQTRYACRPVNACLTSTRLDRLVPVRSLARHGVAAGTRILLSQRAAGRPGVQQPGSHPDAEGDRACIS